MERYLLNLNVSQLHRKCNINSTESSSAYRRKSFRSPCLFYLLTVDVEVSAFHLITLRHTPQSVGRLWTRDQPDAETYLTTQTHTQETNIHAPDGIRTHDPSKRSAADLRLRPRGHWDRRRRKYRPKNVKSQNVLGSRLLAT
jgi:hypothetical protein